MQMDSERQAVARKRITQIFHYLEELNRRRNPIKKRIDEQPWTFRFADLPVNPAIAIGCPPSTLTNANLLSGDTDFAPNAVPEDDYILRVGRSILLDAPPPPEVIADWLQPGLD